MTSKDFKFTLKVMFDKKNNKVLFAESDCQFVDVLLSFLTLPLGRIIRALNDHYVEKAPTIGSLSNLYRSLAGVDNADFVTEDAKKILLNPRSPFEWKYEWLKLGITDSQPNQYFECGGCGQSTHSVSMYCDRAICITCPSGHISQSKTSKSIRRPKFYSGVFAADRASFIISDDLQIFPSVMGMFQIISVLGITNMEEAEAIDVNIGFNEMLSLLTGSFVSPTPLSYVLLNNTTSLRRALNPNEFQEKVGSTSFRRALKPKTLVNPNEFQEKVGSTKMVLKVFIQRSKSKVLYALAEDDFVEFLFCLFVIPLGGVGHLLAGKTCIKALDNLQRSVADLEDKYFKIPSVKKRLMKPTLVHGCVSENYILPLEQEVMSSDELKIFKFSSLKFPKGQGRYLAGPIAYMVTDDLTVNPYCIQSTISTLREKNIPMSDVKEIEVQVGLKEALSILKASITSTSALTDALLNFLPNKQPKTEA